jgi:hypothetical protein
MISRLKSLIDSFIFIQAALLLFLSLFPSPVFSLSNEQKEIFDRKIYYFDSSVSSCSSGPAVSGEISPQVGKGMTSSAQKKFQEILVAAGAKFNVSPNFVAAFYYAENARTADSTNNANSAVPPPVTGDGNWREPAPPYGTGAPYATNQFNTAGAFQFIPSTWAAYGEDGNGDGKVDASNLADGTFGAANYLGALGAKNGASEADLRKAAFGYNHSSTYVDSVLNTYKYLANGGQTDVTQGAQCSSGQVSIDGHVWPADIAKAEVDSGYPWPCSGTCHHDGTPAFDISTKQTVQESNDSSAVGVSVLAISDGKIEGLKIYNGIAGCYSLQLASADGYKYWYGHLRKPAVSDGDSVKAGSKLAEIGERKCTGNGSYPHLHIDRGSPKGSAGGYVCCRDKGMVGLMNELYENLP